ncbi:MAG: capsular polysaccharide biosynthesis protein [Pasteurella oralis]|uniref:capsular polysaccharide biosynthesis protein n=1 Tax=Pasteurella oralis TaxID=1071947 RepID=UPI0026FFEF8C|nr:capsular polysaccharide biosynthesis protein [Pasteurella oralis]
MNAKIFSRGIKKIPNLAQFLAEFELSNSARNVDCVMGWGLRPSTKKARAYAEANNLPYIALEDGFLRSVGLGVAGYPPFSLVYDDVGIYYDTSRPSRLERLILAPQSEALLAEAERAMALICEYQLSKYNQAPDFSESVSAGKEIVLVVDQTFGDMAVKYGQADESHFAQMLQAAMAENPAAEIWVKTHPDVLSGKKQGYLTNLSEYGDQIRLFTQDVSPLSLLNVVSKVYCVTSQMGFEALLLGKSVVTFGVPWFAAWGVTDDRHPNARALAQTERRTPRSLLNLFCAAYLQYSRYIHPVAGKAGTIFDVIDYLHKMKLLNQRLAGDLYCVGMSLWKRAVIKPFFSLPACRLHFVSLQKMRQISPVANSKLLIWGEGASDVHQFAAEHQLPVLRMEDGFIRSVGLGSNLVPPLSLVVDDLGIYFNAQKPSRLEMILQQQAFSESDLQQAEHLRQKLLASHIGKYNVGESGYQLKAQGKRAILVPGQVEDDASIRLGSPDIVRNLDLLIAVRQANPNAYIIYKPHPDVVSGNRVGNITRQEALKYADEVVENANILDCIQQVDEVHTMTSLAGFEALLRDKKVHCYGLPFYSNWGLTTDRISLARRTRRLNLNELIAGVMVYYPLYVNPETRQFVDAQVAIDLLIAQRLQTSGNGIYRSWLSKQFYKLKQLYHSFCIK